MAETNLKQISLNARLGALAIGLCAPLHALLALTGPSLAPLNYAVWLGLTFGILCFCEELGSNKPLNRLGLVLFAAAFCASSFILISAAPAATARAHLLYAFSMPGSLLLWSVALMHRSGTVQQAGQLAATITGGTVVLLLAAHTMLGSITIFGFSQLFEALADTGGSTKPALAAINGILCVWSLGVAVLLWTTPLNAVRDS